MLGYDSYLVIIVIALLQNTQITHNVFKLTQLYGMVYLT